MSHAKFYIAPLARPDLYAGRGRHRWYTSLRDRAELDESFRTEPYCVNGTYQHTEICDSTTAKEGRR